MNTKTIKKCIAILLLAMLSMPAFSQLRFGVRADVGLNNPTFNTEALRAENLTSFSVGPTMELMIPVVNFGIETSLLYNNHRMNVSGDNVTNTEVRNHYLLLPVNAKKKFGLGILPAQLFVTAGPYFGFLLSGDDVRVSEPTSARSPNIIVDDAQARGFQAGIGLGFGVEVLRRLQVGVQYRLQLTDSYDVNDSVLGNVINPLNDRTSTWNLSATFFF